MYFWLANAVGGITGLVKVLASRQYGDQQRASWACPLFGTPVALLQLVCVRIDSYYNDFISSFVKARLFQNAATVSCPYQD